MLDGRAPSVCVGSFALFSIADQAEGARYLPNFPFGPGKAVAPAALPTEPLVIPAVGPEWLLGLCESWIDGIFQVSATSSAKRTQIPRTSARLT